MSVAALDALYMWALAARERARGGGALVRYDLATRQLLARENPFGNT